jgi:hypothetical protein
VLGVLPRAAVGRALVISVLVLSLGVGCGGGSAAKSGKRVVDDLPFPKPPPAEPVLPGGGGAGSEIGTAAARAESEFDSGLSRLPDDIVDSAADAICFGIDNYYAGTDWDDVAEQFEPFQVQVRNLGRHIQEIVETSEDDRELFLRSACALPQP